MHCSSENSSFIRAAISIAGGKELIATTPAILREHLVGSRCSLGKDSLTILLFLELVCPVCAPAFFIPFMRVCFKVFMIFIDFGPGLAETTLQVSAISGCVAPPHYPSVWVIRALLFIAIPVGKYKHSTEAVSRYITIVL